MPFDDFALLVVNEKRIIYLRTNPLFDLDFLPLLNELCITVDVGRRNSLFAKLS